MPKPKPKQKTLIVGLGFPPGFCAVKTKRTYTVEERDPIVVGDAQNPVKASWEGFTSVTEARHFAWRQVYSFNYSPTLVRAASEFLLRRLRHFEKVKGEVPSTSLRSHGMLAALFAERVFRGASLTGNQYHQFVVIGKERLVDLTDGLGVPKSKRWDVDPFWVTNTERPEDLDSIAQLFAIEFYEHRKAQRISVEKPVVRWNCLPVWMRHVFQTSSLEWMCVEALPILLPEGKRAGTCGWEHYGNALRIPNAYQPIFRGRWEDSHVQRPTGV